MAEFLVVTHFAVSVDHFEDFDALDGLAMTEEPKMI